jgi:enoyl-CoA hydratase/carnithine racemase
MPRVLYERDGRIARVTLNRPAALNAIDAELPAELEEAVKRANADAGVHVIVLSGAGRAFCAGYDLAAYAQAAGRGCNAARLAGCVNGQRTRRFHVKVAARQGPRARVARITRHQRFRTAVKGR